MAILSEKQGEYPESLELFTRAKNVLIEVKRRRQQNDFANFERQLETITRSIEFVQKRLPRSESRTTSDRADPTDAVAPATRKMPDLAKFQAAWKAAPKGNWVLVVEDSDELRQSIVDELITKGFQVEKAAGVFEALQLISAALKAGRGRPVVVTDFSMPVKQPTESAVEGRLNGNVLVDYLRAAPKNAERIILMSADLGQWRPTIVKHSTPDVPMVPLMKDPDGMSALVSRVVELVPRSEMRVEVIAPNQKLQLEGVSFESILEKLISKLGELRSNEAAAVIARGFANSELSLAAQLKILLALAEALPVEKAQQVRDLIRQNPTMTELLKNSRPIIELLAPEQANGNVLAEPTVEALRAMLLVNPKQVIHFVMIGDAQVKERAQIQLREIKKSLVKSGIKTELKLGIDVASESMAQKRALVLLNQSGGGVLSLPDALLSTAIVDRSRTTVIRAYHSTNRKLGFLAQFEIAAGIKNSVLESLNQNGRYTLSDAGLKRWSVSAEFAAFIEKALAFATAA